MNFQLKNISIKWQLMTICILLVALPVSIFGLLSYSAVRKDTFNQIEQRLQQQALQVGLLVKNAYTEIQADQRSSNEQARKIVGSQADAVKTV